MSLWDIRRTDPPEGWGGLEAPTKPQVLLGSPEDVLKDRLLKAGITVSLASLSQHPSTLSSYAQLLTLHRS